MANSVLGNRQVITEVTIEARANYQLAGELQTALSANRYVIDHDHMELGKLARATIESVLSAEDLESIRTAWSSAPAIFIIRRAVQIDRLPATPAAGFADDAEIASLNAVLLGFLSLLDIAPTAYSFENDGRMARNVVPNPEFANADSSWGFGTTLAWHQDNNFQPLEFDRAESAGIPPMPRYLSFLGLRNHEKIPTQLLTLDAALENLSGEIVERLQERSYTIAPPQSVGASERDESSAQIVRYQDGTAYSRFDAS